MGYPGNNKALALLLAALLLVLAFLALRQTERDKLYSRTEFMMDTLVTIKVNARQELAEEAISEALAVMKEWSLRLDRYNPDSLIASLNRDGAKGIKVEKEVFELLKVAKEYAALSQGIYDPTIAPLLDLWGFGQEEQRVPSSAAIKSVLEQVNYQKLLLDEKNLVVYLPQDMSLDLGGMAKGFIIDQGMKRLQQLGINSAYINAGGNIRVLGEKAAAVPWKLGIRKPRQPNEVFNDYILGLTQGSLATSGDYERYFIEDGVRYSHLLDPRTGYPARELQAATIYASTALEADLFSTIVFILGWEEGKKLIESNEQIEGMLVKEGQIWTSPGFAKLIIY